MYNDTFLGIFKHRADSRKTGARKSALKDDLLVTQILV